LTELLVLELDDGFKKYPVVQVLHELAAEQVRQFD